MKIIFDLRKTGLGNNGGSSTLIKSGNTLVDMGHEVTFADSMNNRHTWTPLKARHKKIKTDGQLPDADAIIATGYKSVGPTINAPSRCGIKMHWIRAWEHWQMTDDKIVKKVLKVPTIKLVNSICLQKKLKHYDTESYIIRPGYDYDQIFPKHIRGGKKVIIGGLYREGVHGNRKRTEWLFQTVRILKTSDQDIEFWLFGSESKPKSFLVDHYLQSPSAENKNDFYNKVDVWMAPTMSEGLHMPPAEAMLTECPVVATNAELSGTQDYVIHKQTGLVSKNILDDFIRKVGFMVKNKDDRIKMGKEARKKIISLGDRKENMKRLTDLIETLNEGTK